jgi:mRNA interferase HigB
LHVISKRPLRKFWEKHAGAQQPLEDWWKITKHANWHNLAETKRDFPHADLVGACTAFNIGGNKYRLITKINYRSQVVYIRFVLTHPEYSRGGWKDDCY